MRTHSELESLVTVIARERVDAVLVHPSQMIGLHHTRLAALAAQSRLTTIGLTRAWVEAGGLMSYGPRYLDLYQCAAFYVDKLLRGTPATDLPVEQPMKFLLVINLKTATALGLTLPPTRLIQADEAIQWAGEAHRGEADIALGFRRDTWYDHGEGVDSTNRCDDASL